MFKKKVELLAPAGNIQAFYGALAAGADAIYLGGSRFGARAYADNFTTEELLQCIQYAHLFDRKVYLTVNTLVKESEISSLKDYLQPLEDAGVDGLIVQDLGVFQFVKKYFPKLELHGSTQMTLSSAYGARFLKELGATRIVPSRELSLQEISSIKDKVDIELETFIHGAMCYCYSGQCLFSSILGGRSGNRGRCAQPCRLPYTVKQAGHVYPEAYYLSLKDMCTIEHIPDLIHAGIDSFKIEGRMKRPEYAAGVTGIYRKYIDKYYELANAYSFEEAKSRFSVQKKDLQHLRNLYIRSEISDGYYYKYNGKAMVTLKSPSYNGNDDSLLAVIRENYLSGEMKLPVSMEAHFEIGRPASLSLTSGNTTVSVYGNIVESAAKQPITEDNVRRQLSKLGDSVFYCEDLVCIISSQSFYPLKLINELRRQAVEELILKLLAEHGYKADSIANHSDIHSETDFLSTCKKDSPVLTPSNREPGFSISLETKEQLYALVKWYNSHLNTKKIRTLYISGDLLLTNPELMDVIKKYSFEPDIYLALPYVLREKDSDSYRKYTKLMEEHPFLQGLLVRNIDQLSFALQQKERTGIHTDTGLYVWNQYTGKLLGAHADSIALPYELNLSEQRKLFLSGFQFTKVIYGRIPMMITANCLLKTANSCSNKASELLFLKDRYGKEFPVTRNCRHCYNVIYNSVPLMLHPKSTSECISALRIDFTTETEDDVYKVLEHYLMDADVPVRDYTTGHEKRGVE